MKSKFSGAKLVLMTISLTLILCTVIGGTVAWLVARTDAVVNTFTYGDINITLEETDTNKDGDNNPNTNNYPMLPGNNITKDPIITVLKDSENCWLFAKLDKTANFDNFMTFEIADGWQALPGVDGVYYMAVDKTTADVEYTVIKDNTVKVKDEVTKEMLNALDANGATDYPVLTVTAYAVQRDGIITSAEIAWSKVPVNP